MNSTETVTSTSCASRRSAAALVALCAATLLTAAPARAQTAWDPDAIPYTGPSSWQQAAAATLIRHLPTDSGYFVLGPLDLRADAPDTTDLVRTTFRVIAPDPRGSRSVTRRLWVPPGGVALEELQPSDTLPHELPPGYLGRFVKGRLAGDSVLLQVLTVQEHRWLLWAERTRVTDIKEQVSGPIARYSQAVARYLAAVDSGQRVSGPPSAAGYGLEPLYDLYAPPPAPVVRDRSGYLRLLAENRAFTLEGVVEDVYGFIPAPELRARLSERADSVLFPNKDTEAVLQRRYRDFETSGGRWTGCPVLTSMSLRSLRPGRYVYVADRYGFVRVAPTPPPGTELTEGYPTPAMLAHGDPVRAAGELVVRAESGEPIEVAEVNVRSEEYFFSNRALSLYEDVEARSDRYVLSAAHVLDALDRARVAVDDIVIRKF